MANLLSTSVTGTVNSTGNMTAAGFTGNANVGGTGAATWHPSGIYVGSTQWLYGTQYRNNSTTSGQGQLYFDGNYGYGMVGLYSDVRYQAVFAMGDSYKLPVDGSGTGSLYGIAWTHSNIGGESKAGLGHQALFMMSGRTYTAIGAGIWTDGTITTTSHGTSANWNTAYGWGNHASAGYLTSVTNISGNAGTTSQRNFSGDISTSGMGRFTGWYNGNAATGLAAEIGISSGEAYIIAYNRQTSSYGVLNLESSSATLRISGSTINAVSGTLQQGGNAVIHAGNIGSQSVATAGALSSMNISQFTNNSGYITGITSSNVTTALGYTPLSASGDVTIGGYLTVNGAGTSSSIYMKDSDEGNREIHCNSNRIGFLTQAGSWGAYCDDSGNWTAANFSGSSSGTNTGDQTNISGNAATATSAGNADTVDNLHASSFVRNDTTSQYLKPYYEYGSYLTTQRPVDLVDQMGGGGLRVDFLHPSYTANGNWGHVMTWSGYNGYTMYQLSGSYGSETAVELYVRNERNHERTSWSDWRRLLHDGNYNSFAPTLTGGGASGTWGITAANANSISSAVGGSYTWTNTNYFQSNLGATSGSLSSPPLQVYCTGGNSAFMSFHRGSNYAVNFGLDSDNVLRMGGWSASANRWQLDMSGNMTVAGDVTAFSDARVKTNIHTIENALEKTLALRGVSYNRTDSDDTRTKIGVIAQETLEVVPEVVNQDNSGMYNVSYGNMTALLIEAIKEQQAQIEDLKLEVKKLRGE